MFTPFAFFQNAVVTPSLPVGPSGYFIGGEFNTYFVNNQPFFRVLTNSGSISSSFNQGSGFNNSTFTATTQSDGKIIAGGSFTTYSGSSTLRITRLNTNGTIDTSFNPGTSTNQAVQTSIIQPDGKIIIGGTFTTYSGSAANRLTRVNTDGTRDATLNVGAGPNSSPNTIAVQSDGKIVIGGNFSSYSGSIANRLTRVNTDGTRDATLNAGAGPDNTILTLVLQPDGKIIIGGGFTTYSGSAANRLTRVNTDGTRDATLNVGAGFNGNISIITTQLDGQIIIGGAFTTYSGSTANRITRLNTNGTIDTNFNPGIGFDGNVNNIRVQSNGKILITGLFSSYSGSVALGVIRLNNDGSIDNTFNKEFSINTLTQFSALLELSNESILVGGAFVNNRNAYVDFLNINGGLSSSSSISTKGFNNSIYDIVSQSNGQIVMAGFFTTYSGSTANRIVRLNSDFTPGTGSSWNTGQGFNSNVNTIAVQSDGKIIAGGNFVTYSGSAKNYIERLNTDGTSDTGSSWSSGTGFNGDLNSIIIQSDGKIVVGGVFTTYSGSAFNVVNRITRLNTNGTRDTSFNIAGGCNNTVNKLALQSDGKIIATGQFTQYSSSVRNGIVRINSNGTIDTSFNVGTGFNVSAAPQNILIQPDGKVIIGGIFFSYSGSATNNNNIIRLNTDGTKDTTFNTGAGTNNAIHAITLEPGTNKIIIGGSFNSYSGSTANRIVRLNTNGTIDTTFTVTGSGYNSTVRQITAFNF